MRCRSAIESSGRTAAIRDIRSPYRLDRVDDDVPFVHRVTAADLDVTPLPDAHAAADPAASNALTKPFGEDHDSLRPL